MASSASCLHYQGCLGQGSAIVKTIGKIERHTGLWIDKYQVGDADIKAYGSLETIQICQRDGSQDGLY